VALAGVLPAAALGASSRPLAQVAVQAVGAWAEPAIALVAVGGGLACLNGWVLLVGRMPLATDPTLMPEPLRRVHPRYRTPHVALVAGTALTTAFVALQSSTDAVSAFGRSVLIANVGILVPYALTAAAAWRLAEATDGRVWRAFAVAAGLFSCAAIASSGQEALVAGVIFLAAGAGLYVLRSRTRRA
jgi:amino acid transporter